jgi:hypothetical protein
MKSPFYTPLLLPVTDPDQLQVGSILACCRTGVPLVVVWADEEQHAPDLPPTLVWRLVQVKLPDLHWDTTGDQGEGLTLETCVGGPYRLDCSHSVTRLHVMEWMARQFTEAMNPEWKHAHPVRWKQLPPKPLHGQRKPCARWQLCQHGGVVFEEPGPWAGGTPACVTVPAFAELNPDDDFRLSDGSRWIDALSLKMAAEVVAAQVAAKAASKVAQAQS